MQPQDSISYDEPVAYDKDGHPLYAHPPEVSGVPATVPQPSSEQVVHVARAVEPAMPVVGEETAKRHQDSVSLYPTLNLSAGEYIIMEVSKHWIGIVAPIFVGGLLVLLVCVGLSSYPVLVPSGNPPFATLVMPALLLIFLIGLGTYIPVWVYRNNRFFLTNESAIQNIQTSLFSHQEQTISLSSIEDASFHQTGIFQLLLDYGTIRLSTIGDEDTYTFNYVSRPKQKIATLNNAVEAFKNGRPVS